MTDVGVAVIPQLRSGSRAGLWTINDWKEISWRLQATHAQASGRGFAAAPDARQGMAASRNVQSPPAATSSQTDLRSAR
ncbi:MAG: hypothetical protein C0511_11255 [Hyphomicrobium sp.]|nr:hypothetical protein [Hyphomicrobium sp.]PPC81422.1 MAG: hypothetical protein CTY40_07075 [Hyphomicrobium sp.]